MFNLVKNNFMENGKCRYEDGDGNSVFIKRTDKGFVSRLRFNSKLIRAEPVEIILPLQDETGFNLDVNYAKDFDIETDNVNNVLEDYRNLVERWISMIYDILLLSSHKTEKEAEAAFEELKTYPEFEKIDEYQLL